MQWEVFIFSLILFLLLGIATLVGLINPSLLKVKWLNTRFRVFATSAFLFVVFVLAFGEAFRASEKASEAKLKDKTPEFILNHYAKGTFGKNADVWINIHTEDPLTDNIKINAFRETSISSGTLRFQFFNDVSRFMQRVAENEKLKAGTGEHLIGLKTSVTTHGGFQDASIVVSVDCQTTLESTVKRCNSTRQIS